MSKKLDVIRTLVLKLSKERGISLKQLSEHVGRNHAYFQQYVHKGSPRKLPEDVREKLAEALGVDESLLRSGFEGFQLTDSIAASESVAPLVAKEEYHTVPIFDIRASAGHGAIVEDAEPIGHQPFRIQQLTRLTNSSLDQILLIQVAGDSMEPTLSNLDQVMVDMAITKIGRDAIYIIGLEDELLIKRCQVDLETKEILVKSDNDKYSDMRVSGQDKLVVKGRVVWLGRALG